MQEGQPNDERRPQLSDESPPPKFSVRALLVYGAVWAAISAAVVFVVVTLVDGEDSVTLPPVQEIELTAAARSAGCRLRTGEPPDPSIPVAGSAGRPARPGFYEDPPPSGALVGALRVGVIVLHYDPELPSSRIDELRVVQRAVPEGTIVTPNGTMGFAVAATAWRRLLGCPRMTDATIDALRLFRGRYIGQGTAAR